MRERTLRLLSLPFHVYSKWGGSIQYDVIATHNVSNSLSSKGAQSRRYYGSPSHDQYEQRGESELPCVYLQPTQSIQDDHKLFPSRRSTATGGPSKGGGPPTIQSLAYQCQLH